MNLLIVILLSIFSSCVSTNQIQIVEYNPKNECSYLGHGEPIIMNTTHILDEITLCAKFAPKFLITGFLMELRYNTEKVLLTIYLSKFGKNTGFGFFNHYGYNHQMFKWPKQRMKPDVWQQICISASNNQAVLVLNGDAIFNKNLNISNLMYKVANQSYFRLGKYFTGYVTDLNVWSYKLEISDLITMTKSCSVIDTLTPDVFSWDTLKVII